MYCKKCGSQINDGAAFCKKCGAKQTVILSDDEPKEKPDSEEVNKQELPNNTYTDETTTFIENEPSEDNHKTKIKKKWLLLIAIGVPLILIGIFLILWNMGIFRSGLSESDVRTAISNHMRDAHGVRIEEFTNISIDKSGAQATVIIVYDGDGYDTTYPPSTVTLNAQGVVISCMFCQSDSGDNSDNENSSSKEFDDTIIGTFETSSQENPNHSSNNPTTQGQQNPGGNTSTPGTQQNPSQTPARVLQKEAKTALDAVTISVAREGGWSDVPARIQDESIKIRVTVDWDSTLVSSDIGWRIADVNITCNQKTERLSGETYSFTRSLDVALNPGNFFVKTNFSPNFFQSVLHNIFSFLPLDSTTYTSYSGNSPEKISLSSKPPSA